MKTKHIVLCTCLILLAAMAFIPTNASADKIVTKIETIYINEERIDIRKTAENFIVLYDSSGSMDGMYKKTGKKKIDIEKEILKIRNAEFPALTYNAGIYTFTPKAFASYKSVLQPFYPMAKYNKAEFGKAIDMLPTEGSGATPLQWALFELDKILAPLQGHTVVFVVTDGMYSETNAIEKPIELAKELARKFDVSFFVIDSSGMASNPELDYAVSTINPRSRVISFDQFIENPLFLSGALFVIEKNIVKRAVDIERKEVIAEPKVVDVEKVTEVKLGNLLFEFDSATINPKYADPLKKLGDYLRKNPKARLSLSGFTDSKGPAEYNLALSRKRVESVASYLESNYSIGRERIVLNWYGEAKPVASNDTPEGRAQNRRIEGFIFGL